MARMCRPIAYNTFRDARDESSSGVERRGSLQWVSTVAGIIHVKLCSGFNRGSSNAQNVLMVPL